MYKKRRLHNLKMEAEKFALLFMTSLCIISPLQAAAAQPKKAVQNSGQKSLLLAASQPLERIQPDLSEAPRFDDKPRYQFDKIELDAPRLQALVTINKALDPFSLDASGKRIISFPEVLKIAVTQNLDIKIRQEDLSSKNWTLYSSYGQFLPNVSLGYRYQYIHGKLNIPFFSSGAGAGKIDSPFIITNAGFTYYAYRGGKILYTALQNRNYVRASKYQNAATLSDTLFEAVNRYQKLLLSEALLQIRIRAVETSEAQVVLNRDLLQGGKATKLELLQAQTQLSSDKQKLIDQQIERRTAAINLSDLLNIDQGIDLVPDGRLIEIRRLIPETALPAQILKTAVDNRPELKQFRELWLASKKTARIDAANLQPNFQFFGQVYGLGETLSNSSKTVNSAISPITLQQTTPGTPGAIPIQQRVSRQIAPLYTLGYGLNWNFTGLGTVDVSNIQSARAQARQAMLELNKKLNTVTNEVRQSYLKSLSSHRKLEETMAKVESAAEELRLAQLRYQYGVGKNIDVLKAQEDFTSALVENAEAIINFNIAQAQVLRDTGIISVDHLLAKAPVRLEN